MLKKYLKSYAYLFSLILILTIIFSIFNYFFVFPTKIIKILIPIISIFISTIILGKGIKNKAYLEGLKFTSVYVLLSLVVSLIVKNPFNFKLVLCYILMLLSGVIGSMIGINLNGNK